MVGVVAEPSDIEEEQQQQIGFIGDILNLDPPEGSLDIGFI